MDGNNARQRSIPKESVQRVCATAGCWHLEGRHLQQRPPYQGAEALVVAAAAKKPETEESPVARKNAAVASRLKLEAYKSPEGPLWRS